jgi:hypothetical protein
MYFDVDLAAEPPSVELADGDNFHAFEIVIRNNGGDSSRLSQAIAGLGRLDADGYAWLDQREVKRLAGTRAEDPQWSTDFEGLVEYARQHDWVAENGDLRAHCVWPA